MDRILGTRHDVAALLLRVSLGIVIFAHGAQKMLGWWGGYGPRGTLEFFAGLGIPAPLGWIGILTEFVGGILLVLGLGTRLVALNLAIMLSVAVATVHAPNGFFMNWSGQQAGEGYEFFILAVTMALALVVRGGGAWSLDGALVRDQG